MPQRQIARWFARVASLTGLVLLFGANSPALAENFVSLSPVSGWVLLASPTVDVKLQLDFSEVTVGGGIEVTYDATRLEFASFAFAPDPTMLLQTGPGDAETAQPLEVGSGWLILVPPYGVSGHLDVGTFTFRPLAEGFAFVATGPSAMVPGPFYSPTPSDDALTVSFDAATVEVIPEPGFAISITLGGMMLFGFTWAKRTRPHRHQ